MATQGTIPPPARLAEERQAPQAVIAASPRSQSFYQATDSIVRVEVYRLRKKLREFYDGEGAHQPIEIVVATGHYLPEFVDRLPSRPTPDPAQRMPSEHAAGDEETFTPPPRPANRTRQAMLPAVVGVLLVALLGLSRTHPPLAVG